LSAGHNWSIGKKDRPVGEERSAVRNAPILPHHHTLNLDNMRNCTVGCIWTTFAFSLLLTACSDRPPGLEISAESQPSAAAQGAGLTASLPAARPVSAAVATAGAAISVGPAQVDPAAISAKGDPRQWWEAVYAYQTKIGWCHTQFSDLEENGRKLVQINYENHIAVDRQGERTTIDIVTQSVETPEGELLRFHTEINSGASHTQMTGHVADGQLTLKTVTAGKTTTESFPWIPGTLGFSATEQSLSAAPLQPGQHRSLRALMPATNEVVTIDLAADRYEPTPLVDHTEDLLRIEGSIMLPMHGGNEQPPVIRSQLWTNREGQVLKTSLTALHQETYRTTQALALAEPGVRRLDLVVDNTVPVARSLVDPHATRRVKYRVQLLNDDPSKVFYSGGSQEVASLDPHTADITVRRIDGSAPTAPSSVVSAAASSANATHVPTDEDRAPNNLIQSDDDQVQALAKAVAPEETDPWKLAVALEKYVKDIVKLKDFSQAFDTAADVARLREGDCTEHSVLLAALARARGIPARVAIGLIYQPSTQCFVYHMWNELWIANRWVPMDATLGRGGIGAAHLKLTDSNLAGAQAYSCFLPVAQVIGQLKIEILEVE